MFIRSTKELALFVKKQRKKLKLSQTALAERVGLNQKTISAFENKPEVTELATLFRILSAVNVDLTILPKDQISLHKLQWKEAW
jgi:HTH-type transcriptional regulator/antitoxin HipB